MNNIYISIIFRALSLIPLILVFSPVFKSYWQRLNKINGLRRTRVALLTSLFAIIFTNVFFICEGLRALADGKDFVIPNTYGLILDKVITLVSFIVLYHLFKHASTHKK
jgi:hypothetical protein